MARPEKVQAIEEFKANLQGCTIAIATKYKGITVAQATELRSILRKENIRFKVYKNTLAQRGLNELDLASVGKFMEGPTAWAFGTDPVAPAKIIKEFSKLVDKVSMGGGVLDGKPITGAQLSALAALPPRQVLLQQVVGTIAMPMRNLVGALSALPRNLANVVDQIRKQKEEGAAA